MNTMADGAAQRLVDEIDLIRAVLEGYPASIARSDALRAARAIRSALAGQPSSGGQGDALAMIGDNLRSMRVLAGKLTVTQDGNVHLANIKNEIARALQLLDPAVAASQPVVALADSRKGRVYIAGPMTGYENYNFAAFNAAAQKLRDAGFVAVNPADHGIVTGADWSDYLRDDIAKLATCEAIHFLPGWSKSKGATLEHHIAVALGMDIQFAEGSERQPVGQEPVGYRWRHSAGEKWQYSDIPCGWEYEPLYAAPTGGAK